MRLPTFADTSRDDTEVSLNSVRAQIERTEASLNRTGVRFHLIVDLLLAAPERERLTHPEAPMDQPGGLRRRLPAAVMASS